MARRVRGTIRRLPSGRWQARVTASGTQYSLGVYGTRRDAEDALGGHIAGLTAGTAVRPTRLTFRQWAESWFVTQTHLAPATIVSYATLLERHILPGIGHYPLRSISPITLGKWRADRLDAGATPRQVAKASWLIRRILNEAVHARELGWNPALPATARVPPSPERIIPTVEQALALRAAMPPRLRALVSLAAFGGLRLGEMQALRRRDVNLADGIVHVARGIVSVSGRPLVADTKTHNRRDVDLPTFLVEDLEEHLTEHVRPELEAWLFAAERKPAVPVRRTVIYGRWSTARDTVGLPDMHIHDLRHLSGTLGALSGATTRELMDRLGHSSYRWAVHYQHVAEGRRKTVAAGIDELVRETTAQVIPLRPADPAVG